MGIRLHCWCQHSRHCGDGDLEDLAWYEENSDETTQPVGQKQPNAWGLKDMSGNVREWLQDCWNGSYQGAPSNGEAWTSGDSQTRVLRGGSWSIDADRLRPANRNRNDIATHSNFIGFRLVQDP